MVQPLTPCLPTVIKQGVVSHHGTSRNTTILAAWHCLVTLIGHADAVASNQACTRQLMHVLHIKSVSYS